MNNRIALVLGVSLIFGAAAAEAARQGGTDTPMYANVELVAIDPAPCLGDPAFDAIDLLFWRAEDVETIAVRAEQLAPAIGADAGRLLDWCVAFAAMVALEVAEASDTAHEQVESLVALASRA